MSAENIVDLQSRQSEKMADQLAADYKARAAQLVGELVALMREANQHSFQIDFQIQRDPSGQNYAIGPFITKRY